MALKTISPGCGVRASLVLFLHPFSLSKTLFSLLKHYLDFYIINTALKISQFLYCFTTISHGHENYFNKLWGIGMSDSILKGIIL